MGYVSTAHDELLELEEDDEFLDDLTGGQDNESDDEDAPDAA